MDYKTAPSMDMIGNQSASDFLFYGDWGGLQKRRLQYDYHTLSVGWEDSSMTAEQYLWSSLTRVWKSSPLLRLLVWGPGHYGRVENGANVCDALDVECDRHLLTEARTSTN